MMSIHLHLHLTPVQTLHLPTIPKINHSHTTTRPEEIWDTVTDIVHMEIHTIIMITFIPTMGNSDTVTPTPTRHLQRLMVHSLRSVHGIQHPKDQ